MLSNSTQQELTIEEENSDMKILETNVQGIASDQVIIGQTKDERIKDEHKELKQKQARSQSHYSLSRIPTATGSRNDTCVQTKQKTFEQSQRTRAVSAATVRKQAVGKQQFLQHPRQNLQSAMLYNRVPMSKTGLFAQNENEFTMSSKQLKPSRNCSWSRSTANLRPSSNTRNDNHKSMKFYLSQNIRYNQQSNQSLPKLERSSLAHMPSLSKSQYVKDLLANRSQNNSNSPQSLKYLTKVDQQKDADNYVDENLIINQEKMRQKHLRLSKSPTLMGAQISNHIKNLKNLVSSKRKVTIKNPHSPSRQCLSSPKEALPNFSKKRESSLSKERQSKCTFINSQKAKEPNSTRQLSPQITVPDYEHLDTEGIQVMNYLKKQKRNNIINKMRAKQLTNRQKESERDIIKLEKSLDLLYAYGDYKKFMKTNKQQLKRNSCNSPKRIRFSKKRTSKNISNQYGPVTQNLVNEIKNNTRTEEESGLGIFMEHLDESDIQIENDKEKMTESSKYQQNMYLYGENISDQQWFGRTQVDQTRSKSTENDKLISYGTQDNHIQIAESMNEQLQLQNRRHNQQLNTDVSAEISNEVVDMLIEQKHPSLSIIAQIGEKQVNLFNNPLNLQIHENQNQEDNNQITNIITQHLKELIQKKQENQLQQTQKVVVENIIQQTPIHSTQKQSLTVSHQVTEINIPLYEQQKPVSSFATSDMKFGKGAKMSDLQESQITDQIRTHDYRKDMENMGESQLTDQVQNQMVIEEFCQVEVQKAQLARLQSNHSEAFQSPHQQIDFKPIDIPEFPATAKYERAASGLIPTGSSINLEQPALSSSKTRDAAYIKSPRDSSKKLSKPSSTLQDPSKKSYTSQLIKTGSIQSNKSMNSASIKNLSQRSKPKTDRQSTTQLKSNRKSGQNSLNSNQYSQKSKQIDHSIQMDRLIIQNTSSSGDHINEETPQFILDPENIQQLEDVQVHDLSKPSLVFSAKDEESLNQQPFDKTSSRVDVNQEEEEYYDEEEEEHSFANEKLLYDEMIQKQKDQQIEHQKKQKDQDAAQLYGQIQEMAPREEQDSDASKVFDSQHQSQKSQNHEKVQSVYQSSDLNNNSTQNDLKQEETKKIQPLKIVTNDNDGSFDELKVHSPPNKNPQKENLLSGQRKKSLSMEMNQVLQISEVVQSKISIKDDSKEETEDFEELYNLKPQVQSLLSEIYQESMKVVLDTEEELENNSLKIKVINVVSGTTEPEEDEEEYYDEEVAEEYDDEEYYDEESQAEGTYSFRQVQQYQEPIARAGTFNTTAHNDSMMSAKNPNLGPSATIGSASFAKKTSQQSQSLVEHSSTSNSNEPYIIIREPPQIESGVSQLINTEIGESDEEYYDEEEDYGEQDEQQQSFGVKQVVPQKKK